MPTENSLLSKLDWWAVNGQAFKLLYTNQLLAIGAVRALSQQIWILIQTVLTDGSFVTLTKKGSFVTSYFKIALKGNSDSGELWPPP